MDEGRQRTIGIKDVADRAGVSPGTVSNVLNHPTRVTAETRARVLDAIEQLGYRRNASASRLRRLHDTAIGLVVLDVANPFFTDLARAAQRSANAAGYDLMLCDSDNAADQQRRHIRFLDEQRVAGAIVVPTSRKAVQADVRELRDRGVSVIVVDEPAQGADECSIAVDDVTGGLLAGRHLLEGGRTRLLCATAERPFRAFDDRLIGIRRAVEQAGGGTELDIVRVPSLGFANGVEVADVVEERRPDAVFCVNDVVAVALIRALVDRGIDVPGDVAVVGYDDIDIAALAPVPLTSIRQPAGELGRRAVELVIDESRNPDHAHLQMLLQPELVVRQSSGA